MTHRQDVYAVLGLAPGASDREIRRAFRKLVLELHPDRHHGDLRLAARLRIAVEAYESLLGRRSFRHVKRPARPTETQPRFRDRFACPQCFDTFAHDSSCPRCAVPLTDEWRSGPVQPAPNPQVDAMLEMLERRSLGIGPSYEDALHNAPVGVCALLVVGGVLAMSVQVPIASMMLGYGAFLAVVQAFGEARS